MDSGMEADKEYHPVWNPPKTRTMLKRSAVTLISFSAICTLIAFVSPTWLVSWRRLHTPIKRVGLWEFCLSGFVSRTDKSVRSYFGCWWIFAPYYDDIRDILTPPWFKAVQAFMVLCLLVQIVSFILSLCVYACNCLNTYEQRSLFSKILLGLQLVNTLFSLIGSATFGAKCFDSYWMPNPEVNWPSWGFGLAVLAGFSSLLAMAPLWALARLERRHAAKEQVKFPAASSVAGQRRPPPIYSPVAGEDARSEASRQASELQSMI